MRNARGLAWDFPPLRRHGVQRLAYEQWGSGRPVWEADLGDRDLVVDQVEVHEGSASEDAARVLGLGEGESACTRSRRFVLDGKPVHFREEIRSRMPLPEEASKLSPPAGTPVMLVCRSAFTEDGRAVEVNEMVLDAAAYVLEYDLDA